MKTGGSLGFLFLVTLLVPSGGAAETTHVDATLEVSGSVRFLGVSDVAVRSSGLVYDTGDLPGNVAVSLRFQDAATSVKNFPYTITRDPSSSPTTLPMPSENVWNDTASGSLALVSPSANGSYRVLPRSVDGELSFTLSGPWALELSPPQDWDDISAPDHMGPTPDGWDRPLVPAGPAGLLTINGTRDVELQGATFGRFYGGLFRYSPDGGPPQEFVTGERLNPSKTVTDPTGQFGTWWYDRFVLEVEGSSVASRAWAADPKRLLIALRSAEGRWNGDFAFAGVTGAITADGQALPTEPQLFQAIGEFEGRADYAAPKGRWAIAGPATFVGIDGETVRGERGPPRTLAVPVIVGGLTLLALVAAFFTHVGRELLTFITGRNVTGPLDSPTRLAFLRQIAQSPGTTLSQLAAKFDMSSWGSRYHIGVLKRAHYVDEVLNGNTYTYMLNSQSYRFYATALSTTPAPSKTGEATAPPHVFVAGAMAELNHPTRRLVFETLKRHGPAHYATMAQAWRRDGVPEPHPTPRDLTYHATKMEEAGLLFRRREGAHVVWGLNLNLPAVERHQRLSFLRDPAVNAVYQSLAGRPRSTLAQILDDTSNVIRKKPRAHVQEILLRLEQAGILRNDKADGSYTLA